MILLNELNLRKIATRWVPHVLTEVQRWLRYAIRSDHFARWQQEVEKILSRIISIDEFWARAYEPDLKCQSTDYRPAGSPWR
ncbi:histone-lysine N-methyltransferase SETMAR [Trichonephila clavata]|uniref:Histone-lysine N-methyltransferase SETMAR n=1 Tax=Trichonephila clavata TaxID=2740835 RepID=A0A8X6L3R5_TRICU|nr:histone-lysine N-methyltransferase SETMAR [Trichonephila clavata]